MHCVGGVLHTGHQHQPLHRAQHLHLHHVGHRVRVCRGSRSAQNPRCQAGPCTPSCHCPPPAHLLPGPCPAPVPSPMAVSSHLGLFQVSVMALPVTEATVGGPSGGVGTTSAWGGRQECEHGHCRSSLGRLAYTRGDAGWRGRIGPATLTGSPGGLSLAAPVGLALPASPTWDLGVQDGP